MVFLQDYINQLIIYYHCNIDIDYFLLKVNHFSLMKLNNSIDTCQNSTWKDDLKSDKAKGWITFSRSLHMPKTRFWSQGQPNGWLQVALSCDELTEVKLRHFKCWLLRILVSSENIPKSQWLRNGLKSLPLHMLSSSFDQRPKYITVVLWVWQVSNSS